MEVTTNGRADPTADRLTTEVLRELRAARKRSTGLTPDTIGDAPYITALLGTGDSATAFAHLTLHLIGESQIHVLAACYSLGLASKAKSHLARLTDFGSEYGFEQRQARRYSDQGLLYIANRMVHTWSTLAAPLLTLVITQPDDVGPVFVHARTAAFELILMRRVQMEALINDKWTPLEVPSTRAPINGKNEETYAPVGVTGQLGLRWIGEMIPNVAIKILGMIDQGLIEVAVHGAAVHIACTTGTRPA